MEALWGGFTYIRGLMVRINFLYELSYASLSYVFQEYGNTSIKDINRYNFFKILAIYRTNIRYYDNEQRSILVVLTLGHGAIYKRFTSNDAAHRLRTAMIIGNQYSQDYMRNSIRGIKYSAVVYLCALRYLLLSGLTTEFFLFQVQQLP